MKGFIEVHCNKLPRLINMQITADYVNIVRFGKNARNWGALAYTTCPDGMYYELNYVGDKDALYLDVY